MKEDGSMSQEILNSEKYHRSEFHCITFAQVFEFFFFLSCARLTLDNLAAVMGLMGFHNDAFQMNLPRGHRRFIITWVWVCFIMDRADHDHFNKHEKCHREKQTPTSHMLNKIYTNTYSLYLTAPKHK